MKKLIFILIFVLIAAGGGVATSLLLAPKAHNLVYYKAVEPTCETPGNLDYYYCKECNKYYNSSKKEVKKSDLILPALGHVYEFQSFEWIDDNYDFCEANFICVNDNEHTYVERIELEKQVTPATITEVAVVKYTAKYGTHKEEKIVYGTKTIVPEFRYENGFYNDSIKVEIFVNNDFDIYYTLDGSTPTTQSTKYTDFILIDDTSNNPNVIANNENISALDVFYPTQLLDKCVVIKAIAVDKAGHISKVSQRCYFIGFEDKLGYDNLPIVSLSLDTADLFDYEKGIYVKGQTYDEDDYSELDPEKRPANYNQKGEDWEKAGNIIFFNEQRNCVFSQDIKVKIHDDLTNVSNQKSFDLFVNSIDESLPLFGDSMVKSCTLTSGGYYDSSLTKMRDLLNHDLSRWENTFDVQQGYPCVVFLNGEYWGIYNIQENYDKDYINKHYGIDSEDVVMVKNDEIFDGEEEDASLYDALVEVFTDNTFIDQENYELAGTYVDLEEFASYMAVELYIGNIDWPNNNVMMWRSKTIGENPKQDAKWHFMLCNTNASLAARMDMCSANVDPFQNSAHLDKGPLDDSCLIGLMFTKLMQNDAFKLLFQQAILRLGDDVFDTEIVNQYLDMQISLLQDNIEKHYARFVSEDATIYNKDYFLEQVQLIKDFFEQRQAKMLEFIASHF